jgi:hypothetical protein
LTGALLIAVLPYINVQEESYQYSAVLFYDSKNKTLTPGDRWNSYERLYLNMFSNLSEFASAISANNVTDFADKKGSDIIEKGIIESLMSRFLSHWDVIWREQEHGPTGTSYSGMRGSTEASKQISLEEIRKAFSHNSLISSPGTVVYPGFNIPPKSNFRTSQTDTSRFITITTPYSTVSIAARRSSLGVLQHGVWGVLRVDPEDMNRYYEIVYQVSLTIHLKRFKKHAPEMRSYSRWHENIREALHRFDWQYVDKQIEQREIREHISGAVKESDIK